MIHAIGTVISQTRANPNGIAPDRVYLVFGFDNVTRDYLCKDRNGNRVDISEQIGDQMAEVTTVLSSLSSQRLSRDPREVRRANRP